MHVSVTPTPSTSQAHWSLTSVGEPGAVSEPAVGHLAPVELEVVLVLQLEVEPLGEPGQRRERHDASESSTRVRHRHLRQGTPLGGRSPDAR